MQNSLKDSYVYKVLALDRITQKIANDVVPNLNKHVISDEYLSMITNDVKAKSVGIGKDRIVRNIQVGDIIIINTPGISIPAFCVPKGNKIVAICNIFGKVKVSKDKSQLTYQVKEIFGLLVVAETVKNFFRNEGKFLYNSQLISNVGAIYARMMMRVIDSMFSINVIGNERESQFIEYMIIKFYLRRVIEKNLKPNDESANIASIINKSKKNSTILYSVGQHQTRSETFPAETFTNLDTFCKAMAENVSSLRNLETNVLLRKVILQLGEKATLMLENPQFLFAYLASSAYNTNLIKDFQMASIGGDLLASVAASIMDIDTN